MIRKNERVKEVIFLNLKLLLHQTKSIDIEEIFADCLRVHKGLDGVGWIIILFIHWFCFWLVCFVLLFHFWFFLSSSIFFHLMSLFSLSPKLQCLREVPDERCSNGSHGLTLCRVLGDPWFCEQGSERSRPAVGASVVARGAASLCCWWGSPTSPRHRRQRPSIAPSVNAKPRWCRRTFWGSFLPPPVLTASSCYD